jgi:hypothetical protein
MKYDPQLPGWCYPFNEWKDGRWREFEEGVDFYCTPVSFATTARHHGFRTVRKKGVVSICFENPRG